MAGSQLISLAWRLCAGTICISTAASASADLYQTRIPTIEWLTDNSDVILITQVPVDSDVQQGRVLRVLKGRQDEISYPLRESSWTRHYDYLFPKVRGRIRLRFIHRRREVLYEVQLHRPLMGERSSLSQHVYGVTQYEKLLLTQKDLLDCVARRLIVNPGPELPVHEAFGSATRRSGQEASEDFPLDENDLNHVLLVPFKTKRRDHFLKQLKSGDAIEQLRALAGLARFDDAQAQQALVRSTRIEMVTQAVRYWPNGEHVVTASDVRSTARRLLEMRNE